jgi:hypothetical protein
LRYFIFLLMFISCLVRPVIAVAQQAEPWQSSYADKDAQGDHVVAFWKFEGEGATFLDASGNGHDGSIAGVKRTAEGRFGAGITSFCGWPVEDIRHAVSVPHVSSLCLQGAFTLEMWLRPGDALADYGAAHLMDKKYVAHRDYQWVLDTPDSQGNRHMRLCLGFGEDSEIWWSRERARFEAGVWYHMAVSYDGAGTVNFIQNGRSLGGATKTGRGSVHPGTHLLSIGDRVGSLYSGFPGDIDEVRITKGVREFRPLTISAQHRRAVYRRMEPKVTLQFQLNNVSRETQANVQASITLPGMPPKRHTIPPLASGETHDLSFGLDTRLRTGDYAVHVTYALGEGERAYRNRETFPVTIVPRTPPHRMPVVMWGVGGVKGVTENTSELKDIGFTHCLGLRCDFSRVWDAGDVVVPVVNDQALEESYRMLDQALADDLGIVISLGNGHWMEQKPELLRIDQEGAPYPRKNICCNAAGVFAFSENVGASVIQTYGEFPAFDAALLNSEVRDSSQLCFHDHDRAAYREATGREYPETVRVKNGVPYGEIENFPANRVVPDDHELLQFYRWFWRTGDGWNSVNSAMNNGLKSTGRNDLWTFFDPAARVPSLWGSGGAVDYISHWTYSYPDPIRIGLTTDELFAMAEGGVGDQAVMKMTQIIWYRSQTAPAADSASPDRTQSAWEDYDPDAAYITIAPMHLKEAFWTKIARPIQGIMYHGWQSLVPTEGSSAYRYTHPETRNVLKDLIHTVVEPLGPTLLQVPAVKADVAFLQSFTSQIFARRGTYGWGGSWAGDAYHVLQYAHLQSEIIYEETIQQQGLDGFRVLVLTDCDVLPESIVAAIQAFQKAGGIIVGDERLCPAIKADILVASYARTKDAQADKAALLARAKALRTALTSRYVSYLDSSEADVLPYRRRFGSTDYIFAINDRREYGNYVGQHGLVMENGLPAEATLTIQRGGHVYDLLEHREINPHGTDTTTGIDVQLEPGGGQLLMMTQSPIASLSATGPAAAHRNDTSIFIITIADESGAPLDAVVPVALTILDPEGRRSERSGYYGAANGTLSIALDHAPNDTTGMWTVKIRELASGKSALHFFRLSE